MDTVSGQPGGKARDRPCDNTGKDSERQQSTKPFHIPITIA
jgi:hypothetical protein